MASEHGFSFHWQDGQIWRNYVVEEDGLHVIVVQPIKYRFKEIAATSLGYATILLLLWLLQWAIVHFMIGRQFKRIQQLSQQIAEKNQHDLTPIIPTQPELKELQPMLQQLNKLLGRVEQSLIAEQRFTADAAIYLADIFICLCRPDAIMILKMTDKLLVWPARACDDYYFWVPYDKVSFDFDLITIAIYQL